MCVSNPFFDLGTTCEKYKHLVDGLKVYSVSTLISAMAEDANKVNPEYRNYLVDHKLTKAAGNLTS